MLCYNIIAIQSLTRLEGYQSHKISQRVLQDATLLANGSSIVCFCADSPIDLRLFSSIVRQTDRQTCRQTDGQRQTERYTAGTYKNIGRILDFGVAIDFGSTFRSL